jgi:fucose permease
MTQSTSEKVAPQVKQVLTPAMGWISEEFHSVALAYVVPLSAYVIIALYSFFGARARSVQTT